MKYIHPDFASGKFDSVCGISVNFFQPKTKMLVAWSLITCKFSTVILNEMTAQCSFRWAADLVQLQLQVAKSMFNLFYFQAAQQHFIDIVAVVGSQLLWYWAVGFWPLCTVVSLFQLLLRKQLFIKAEGSVLTLWPAWERHTALSCCAAKQVFSQLCHETSAIGRVM